MAALEINPENLSDEAKHTESTDNDYSIDPTPFWRSPIVKLGAVFVALKVVDILGAVVKHKLTK